MSRIQFSMAKQGYNEFGKQRLTASVERVSPRVYVAIFQRDYLGETITPIGFHQRVARFVAYTPAKAAQTVSKLFSDGFFGPPALQEYQGLAQHCHNKVGYGLPVGGSCCRQGFVF